LEQFASVSRAYPVMRRVRLIRCYSEFFWLLKVAIKNLLFLACMTQHEQENSSHPHKIVLFNNSLTAGKLLHGNSTLHTSDAMAELGSSQPNKCH
jgi:hypothetical protein